MRKAIGLILGFGMVAILLTVLTMMMSMGSLADSPVGDRARLATELKKEYGGDRVTSDSPATVMDLVFTFHVTIPKSVARPTAPDEEEARRLYTLGRMDVGIRRGDEAEEKFRQVQEQYPNTAACAELRLFRAATYVQKNYRGADKSRIGKITVKQRTTKEALGSEVSDGPSVTIDMGIPRESP